MSILSKKQAIQIGIESVAQRTDLPPRTKQEAIDILTSLFKRDWYNDWNKDSIVAALKKYKEDTGKTPTVTSLNEAGMPKAVTIRSYFHISPSLFLKQLFPENRDTNCRPGRPNQYGFETEEEWLNCFAEQFNKHSDEGMCCTEYNKLRDKGTPSWQLIAKHCDVKVWTELMEKAGVGYKKKMPKTAKHIYVSNISSPTIEKLEQINKQRKLLNSELYDMLSTKNKK